MVDLDDLRDQKDSSSSGDDSGSGQNGGKEAEASGSKTQSGGGGDSGGIGEEQGTFSLEKDDMVDPSNKTVSKTSKEWADDGGEMNYNAKGGETFEQYANRQVKEVEELHENIREMAGKHMENFDEFTLYFHALFLNFAQNRVGIAETIENQFGKSKKESLQLADKICERAGESEFMKEMLNDITDNLADL